MRFSVTVDFPDDIAKGPYDQDRLGRMMDMIRGLGASRVYWMDYRDSNIWGSHWAAYGPQTLRALGDPLRAAAEAAHARGLEIVAVLKPYNFGLSGTYPTGSPEAKRGSRLTRIGGTLQQAIPFLEAHPHVRVRRRPWTHISGPIRTLRLFKADAAETRVTPERLRLWTSSENFRYRPLDRGPLKGSVTVEPAPAEVRDYHGNVLTRAGQPVRVVTLSGLDLNDPFVVVTTDYREGSGDFRNTPLGMVRAYGDGGAELDCALATHAALWIRPRDFRTYGLEFDQGYGHLPVALDAPWTGVDGDPWKPFTGADEFGSEALFGHGPAGGFVGIARGRNETLATTPCECCAEVRRLWLDWVDGALEAGADGVNLRVSAHGGLSDEPEAYGWNPEVLSACRDENDIARVRGDAYSAFVREAADRVRAAGKRLHAHLHAEAFRSDPVFGQRQGIPANVEFQWRRWIEAGWLDEVYLRTSWFEAAEDPLGAPTRRSRLAAALAEPVCAEMLEAAARHRLPVTLNRYIGRAAGTEEYVGDLERIAADGRFAGFDVYEFFDLAQSDPSRGELVPRLGRIEAVRAAIRRSRERAS